MISILIWLYASFSLSGQKYDIEQLAIKYPSEVAIFGKKSQEIFITQNNGLISITTNYHQEMVYLKENAGAYSDGSILSSSFMKPRDIQAYTLVPNKNKYKKVPVTKFTESFDSNSSSFYDDRKYIKYTFPSIQKGAITVETFEEDISDPLHVGILYMSSYLPVLESNLKVSVDASIDLGFTFFNGFDSTRLTKSVSKSGVVYEIKLKDIVANEYDDQAPSSNYYVPHLGIRIKGYSSDKSSYVTLQNTYKDLHRRYRSYIQDLEEDETTELRGIVDQLVSNTDGKHERAKKIFYWVQDHIKYIAIENGMRGFIPNKASMVCKNRYGDCKDMSSILKSMLEIADVPAYLTWVGTKDISYSYVKYPSIFTDNHMIVASHIDDEWIFMDATGQYHELGLATSMIEGKQAMISISEDSVLLRQIPITTPSSNLISDHVEVELNQNTLRGSGTMHLFGQNKAYNSHYLLNSDERDTEDFVSGLIERGSNKFKLLTHDIANLKDRNSPLQIDYTFEIPDYVQSIGNYIYINLNLERSLVESVIDKKRKLPIELEYQYSIEDRIELTIPDGYEVSFMPESVSHDNDVLAFNIEYETKLNKVIRTRKILSNSILLRPSEFEPWNESIELLTKAYQETLILSRNTKE